MPDESLSQQRLMRAAAHTPGGYGGVPQKVGREFVNADKGMPAPTAEHVASHPRQHSLAMASADTLHKAGYISSAHRDKIRAHAGKKLDAHKKTKEAAYGSLAPAPMAPDADQDAM